MDKSIHESDDSIILKNNAVFSVLINIGTILIFCINIYALSHSIKEMLPAMFCIYEIAMDIERQLLNS